MTLLTKVKHELKAIGSSPSISVLLRYHPDAPEVSSLPRTRSSSTPSPSWSSGSRRRESCGAPGPYALASVSPPPAARAGPRLQDLIYLAVTILLLGGEKCSRLPRERALAQRSSRSGSIGTGTSSSPRRFASAWPSGYHLFMGPPPARQGTLRRDDLGRDRSPRGTPR